MKKIYLFLCFIVLLLTGCGTQDYIVVINNDNTIDVSVQIYIDQDTYNSLSKRDIDLEKLNEEKIKNTNTKLDEIDVLFQETAYLFQQSNYEVIPISDGISVGFTAFKKYLSIEEFNTEIKKMYQENLIGLDMKIINKESILKKEYKISGTLSYLLDPDVDTTLLPDDIQYDTKSFSSHLYLKVPTNTKVSATNTEETEIRGYVWNSEYNKDAVDIGLYASSSNQKLMAIIFIIVFAFTLLFVFLIIRKIKVIKDKKNGAMSDKK